MWLRASVGFVTLVAAAVTLLAQPTPTVSAGRVPDTTVTYRIERDNKPVGSYKVRSFDNHDGAEFDSQLAIATKVGPFKVRITHEAAETWTEAGQLRQLASETDRNGDRMAVTALPDAKGRLMVQADGKTAMANANVLTNSFTYTGNHFGAQAQKVELLDVLSGALRPSTIVPRGTETIACPSGSCAARRFDVVVNDNGKVSHQLWLDSSGMVLKLVANTRFGISFAYVQESLVRRAT
jgi:Family of unknown function (DUF6134)